MNAVVTAPRNLVTLQDRYEREAGTVYLTGIQALVRTVLDRARMDRRFGNATAAFISGYEGSPLAGYDLELARQQPLLSGLGIVHQPGLNEELAATAVSGSQLARSVADLRPYGVTGYWYGKAPGLDRASDALRHANLIGSDSRGGAIAFVGDDPAAKSSSIPCTSELSLVDLGIPTFVPADPADILTHGLHAVELSRATGLWSALKVATVVADGASTVSLDATWAPPAMTDLPAGLRAYAHRPTAHLLGATLRDLEDSFHHVRLPLAVEYIRRSGVNAIAGPGRARIGIIAAGPTYLALRQALAALGITGTRLDDLGIRLLKLGAVYPLEPSVVRDFASGLDRLLIVEDKRPFLEDSVKAVLYGVTGAPQICGKRTTDGVPLFSPLGELDADAVAGGLYRYLSDCGVNDLVPPAESRRQVSLPMAGATSRTPFFCSGCPHNSSTEVAPGTLVGGGIGCHAMLLLMPGERSGDITGLSQMGGEGAQWFGMAPFVGQQHYVQNIGDGTFAHSGSLAVRAAVAAGVNVTFKLLRNSAVAMTGGQQPVGEIALPRLVELLQAEGVQRVVVTSDDPGHARRAVGDRCEVRSRDDLLDVQRELAEIAGVTVLIHDQECAAEKRRKRRRGKVAAPAQRVFINERVCEGCGDCGAKSNCLSVHPVETDFGRKTRINQSSCNLDFSCLAGDCPSFLTVVPGSRKKHEVSVIEPPEAPATPPLTELTLRITGIGGTGVVTVSQVLATAASIEGHFVRTLDQTGLAQKGGAVVSDVVVTAQPTDRSPKLAVGECDVYLACDGLVATDPANLKVAGPQRTTAVVSLTEVPTGAMVIDPDASYPQRLRITGAIHRCVRQAHYLDAADLAARYLGDEQYANMVLVGAAFQTGALRIGADAIEQAIRLNGTAVEANIAAFRHGRWAIARPGSAPEESEPEALDDVIRDRAEDLAAYQNPAYRARYLRLVERVRERELAVVGDDALALAVARNLHKLMAYKDEYEVARLSLDPALGTAIVDEFGQGATYQYRLHPPALRALGMKRKLSLGSRFRVVFRLLVVARRLRGTVLDPFGRAEVRRVERALVVEYEQIIERLLEELTPANHRLAVQVAELPDIVRGYEHVKLRNVERYRQRIAELLNQRSDDAAPPDPTTSLAPSGADR